MRHLSSGPQMIEVESGLRRWWDRVSHHTWNHYTLLALWFKLFISVASVSIHMGGFLCFSPSRLDSFSVSSSPQNLTSLLGEILSHVCPLTSRAEGGKESVTEWGTSWWPQNVQKQCQLAGCHTLQSPENLWRQLSNSRSQPNSILSSNLLYCSTNWIYYNVYDCYQETQRMLWEFIMSP